MNAPRPLMKIEMKGATRTMLRSGHAPGHLREAFFAAIADRFQVVESEHPGDDFLYGRTGQLWSRMTPTQRVRWITGQLWNCTDIMPGHVREEISDHFDEWEDGRMVEVV